MAEVRLSAEPRTEFGKGGARRTRRAGKIPAVIYGHGADPRHVSLPAREFTAAVKHGGANVLLTLNLEGSEQLAIPKAIQRNPLKDTYEHVDLLAVRRGEKVTIDVPISVHGEVARGGLLAQENTSVSLEAEATHLPTEIVVDISELEIGAQIKASDLALPSGAALTTDPEQILLIIQEAPTAEQLEGETTAEGQAAEPADRDAAATKPAAESEE
ncbi:MAG: 50S ribosomal protein L25/general stress protein Ctc [Actinobacteria bacterium]|nr:50S ribosomal protein L25/general stress protein Ctc [Actinomycetota bacterium]